MVLSNLNNNMDVESRTMATMGDTLGGSGAETEALVQGAREMPCQLGSGGRGHRLPFL